MKPNPKYRFRRPGTLYVAVLGCATVIAVLGVSAIMVTRVEGRVIRGSADLAVARSLAQSSIDIGLFTLYSDVNWRTTKSQGAWRTAQTAGEGSITLSVADPIDGTLGDARWEPVVFTGTGTVREARYLLEATSVANPLPLPCLNTCLHTNGKVTVSLLKNITVAGAPLSMNGSINGPGTVTGNIQAASLGIVPIVVGTSIIPSAAKEMPDAGVLAMYKSLATTMTGYSDFDRDVLTPDYNPRGTVNPDGVYFFDGTPGAADIKIKRSRINGTLIVKCATGKKVVLDDTVFLQNFRSDYPVLIVEGDLEFALNSASYSLSEATEGVNLNPATAPYLGVGDSDQTDTYPNEVKGLVYVTGRVTFSNASKVTGVIIAIGNVTVSGTPTLVHNPTIYSNPPMGFVTYAMQIAHGSWRRIVSP